MLVVSLLNNFAIYVKKLVTFRSTSTSEIELQEFIIFLLALSKSKNRRQNKLQKNKTGM